MIWWISTIAPTSTPRVGSSKMTMRGRSHQPLADHHLLLVAAGQLDDAGVVVDGPDAEPPGPFGRQRLHLPDADHPGALVAGGQQAGKQVLGDRHGLEECPRSCGPR